MTSPIAAASILLLISANLVAREAAWGTLAAKSDDWYRSEEGHRVAANILSFQSPDGSWPKNTNTTQALYTGDRSKLHGTFDNGATTGELRFLARAFKATHEPLYEAAFTKGIDHILKAQYPSGGWPQYYPPPKSYHRYITFNDDAMVRLLQFLRDVATDPGFDFLGAPKRVAAQSSFDRGIDCILKCQIKVGGKLTAWCAQHDEITFEPRLGRTFELASLSGSESVGIVRLLMSLDHPSTNVIAAIRAAVEWFESAKISGIKVIQKPDPKAPKGVDRIVENDSSAPAMWARFYEIGSNKAIFADRDGIMKYHLADIGYERRNGYAWLGYWPESLLSKDFPRWQAKLATAVPR